MRPRFLQFALIAALAACGDGGATLPGDPGGSVALYRLVAVDSMSLPALISSGFDAGTTVGPGLQSEVWVNSGELILRNDGTGETAADIRTKMSGHDTTVTLRVLWTYAVTGDSIRLCGAPPAPPECSMGVFGTNEVILPTVRPGVPATRPRFKFRK